MSTTTGQRLAAQGADAAPGWLTHTIRGPLRRLPAAALVLGSIAALGASDGGYFPSSWGWSALLFAWTGGLAVVVERHIAVRRSELAYLGALTGVLLWTATSLLWTPSATQTMYELERTLSYVTFACAFALLVRAADVPIVVGALLAAVTALCGYGLLTRILPGRLTTFDSVATYRLASPLGYWNAVGAIAAFGIIAAVGVAARARSAPARALAAAATVVLVPTLYFTFGRGGWVALMIGLAVLVAIDPRRLQLLAILLAIAPWPALAIWRAYESKGLTTDYSPLSTASTDGRRLAWTLLALAVAAFLWMLAVSALENRVPVPVWARRIFAVSVVLAAVALAAGTIAAYGGPSRVVSKALDSIHRATPNVHGDQTQRLFSLSTNGRLTLWSVALDDAREHPVLGSGAGSFEEWWIRHRPVPSKVRDAHSLFVEQLAELGVVGLALLVAALAIPLATAIRFRRHPYVPVACGGLVAYVVHAAADWDWEMPAVTLCGLVFAGAVLTAARSFRPALAPAPAALERTGFSLRAATAGLLLAASALAFVAMIGNRALAQAAGAADNDDVAAVIAHAKTAARWSPWSSDPIVAQADAALERGRRVQAQLLYERALRKDPHDWEIWFSLALATDGKARQRALAHASSLDPLSPEILQLRAAGT